MCPTYDFICSNCMKSFEEIKGITAYCEDPTSICPYCGTKCGSQERDFSKSIPIFYGSKVENAEFNPGLGCVVKNQYHKSEILKKKGLFEIGNDYGSGEKMQNQFEKQKEKELEKKWEDPKNFFIE